MRIGSTHDLEVRLQETAVVALIDDPGQVASALESIIAKVKTLMPPKTKVTGIAAMVTQMSENGCGDAEILAMFAAKGQSRGRPRCWCRTLPL